MSSVDHVHKKHVYANKRTLVCADKHAELCRNTKINVMLLMLQEGVTSGDAEMVADKLAAAKAWLVDLRQQQKEVDADKKMLEAEEDRLVIRQAILAKGLSCS